MTGCTTEAGVPAKNFDTQRIPSLQPLVDEFWCDQVATKSTKNLKITGPEIGIVSGPMILPRPGDLNCG